MGEGTSSEGRGVATVHSPQGAAGIVLVCEHASNWIPPELGGLGLPEDHRALHIAWDPGAAAVARALSRLLDAPLVEGGVSRLVYDCNRPPEALDAIPIVSEIYRVPGNESLSEAERADRVAAYYRPFESLLSETLKARQAVTALVSIHSFAPVFCGRRREVEIGVVSGEDPGLADALIDCARAHTDHLVRGNEPYGQEDGVAHTLNLHGVGNGLANAMFEIRNDLIADPGDQKRMAVMLSAWLRDALARLRSEVA